MKNPRLAVFAAFLLSPCIGLATGPYLFDNDPVFSSDVEISYDNDTTAVSFTVPTGPSRPGEKIGSGGTTSGTTSLTFNCQGTVTIGVTNTCYPSCPVPPAGSIPDWTSLKVVEYGLQIDNGWNNTYSMGLQRRKMMCFDT